MSSFQRRSFTGPSDTEAAFFKKVLGADVPSWPYKIARANNIRVQVWTYQVKSVLDASKRLRENGIPVVFSPVAITTPYLGDHKMLGIRAPDGTMIELVETSAQ